MSSFDDLVLRIHDDPAFAERVRSDPLAALAGHRLSNDELRTLDGLVRRTGPPARSSGDDEPPRGGD